MDDLFKKTITYKMTYGYAPEIADEQKVYFEGEYIGSVLWSISYWKNIEIGHEPPLDDCIFKTMYDKYKMPHTKDITYKKVIEHLNKIAND